MARRFLVVLCLLLSRSVLGAVVVERSVEELARRSDLVIRGRVESVSSRWAPDGRTIISDVELRPIEALKGSPGQRVLIRQPGGTVDELSQSVPGSASFSEGEEVLVFLGQAPHASFYRVEGMAQGKYRLSPDPRTGQLMAQADLHGLGVLKPGEKEIRPAPVQAPLPFAALERRVQQALSTPAVP